ncbi:MAG TPA: WYL domain-containing protein [Allosphingosinicella sp.]|nr:WYL domain-containing protein [Allosphingosinicella sp.]
MRASRLLTILMTLQVRGRATAARLADALEVSTRTIYRDVDELSAAGIPIYADRGPGGGFALLDGYRTRITGLSPVEAEALFLLGLPGPAADIGLAGPAAAAALKMLASLPPDAAQGAARIAARIHVDPAAWYRRNEAPRLLGPICRAAWDDRAIAADYESWTATGRRRLAPLGIVLKGGIWYFVADAGKGPAIFRVDKIREMEVLDEHFVRPEGFTLASWWPEQVETFEASLQREKARLRVPVGSLSRFGDFPAATREAVEAAEPDAEGAREAVVPIESVEQAARLLLPLSPPVEVLAPAALRERLAEMAAATLALYAPVSRRESGDSGRNRRRA